MSTADAIAGGQRCLYGTAEACCGKPAAVHVLVYDGVPTMDCVEHASWWDTHECLDAHMIGGACGLPGTTWTHEGCFVEGLDA